MQKQLKKQNNIATSKKRMLIAIFMILVIAIFFWTQSRYPALNEKKSMGEMTITESLAFDVIWPINEGTPFYERVLASTVNWCYTNWKGMVFGLLIAAGVLTFFSMLSWKSKGSLIFNTIQGMLMGAPLGVCVNCVAPIAKGLYESGQKIEKVLTVMFSSPTLNIVVLILLFNLFPYHFAMAKIIATFCVLFIIVPLLSKYVFCHERNNLQKANDSDEIKREWIKETWGRAFFGTSRIFVKHLVYICITTAPLMLFAGFLGSLLVELLPVNALSDIKIGAVSIVIVALIGTFLPVPIAFDVIVVHSLMQAGLSPVFTMILLFTLGIFSIYTFSILWMSISPKVAVTLFFIIMVVGIIAGLSIEKYDAWRTNHIMEQYKEFMQNSEDEDMVRRIKVRINNYCQELKEHSLVLECNTNTFNDQAYVSAVRKKDLKYCQYIEDETGRMKCLNDSASDLAVQDRDIKWCDQSGIEKLRDKCYLTIIEKPLTPDIVLEIINDGDLCGLIQDSEIKEKCEQKKNWAFNQKKYRYYIVSDPRNRTNVGKNDMIFKEINVGDCLKYKSKSKILRCASYFIGGKMDLENAGIDLNSKTSFFGQFSTDDIKAKEELFSINQNQKNFIKKDKIVKSPEIFDFYKNGNVSIKRYQHQMRKKGAKKLFQKIQGMKIGIVYLYDFTSFNTKRFFLRGRSIASGDFNNDHWQDLAIASSEGVVLYKNRGDGTFALKTLSSDLFNNRYVDNVALVDINNDGWQDIFLSISKKGEYFILNDKKEFKDPEIISVIPMNQPKELRIGKTRSSSFGDINRDGYLDFYIGKIGHRNTLYINENLNFLPNILTNSNDVTLSVLFTDFNLDGNADLMVGNDFVEPDYYYTGNGTGQMKLMTKQDKIITKTTQHTMSMDVADINNDLLLDIFSVDMNFHSDLKKKDYCLNQMSTWEKRYCEQSLKMRKIIKKQSIKDCMELDQEFREVCAIGIVTSLVHRKEMNYLCSEIPDIYAEQKVDCQNLNRSQLTYQKNQKGPVELENHIYQYNSNILNVATLEQKFVEQAEVYGVKRSGWSWNAKFADLDNDEWQDIYIVNGLLELDHITSNKFFKNIHGEKFIEKQEEAGLSDYLETKSYTYIDIENDGDIDIITPGTSDLPRVFINNESSNYKITFKIRDFVGNRFGIGTKILIYYGKNNSKHQIREIKSGGGFMSFDAPIAHFGLGQHQRINKIIIQWSTGEISEIDHEFESDHTYIVSRLKE